MEPQLSTLMICKCCKKPTGILVRRDGEKICGPCEIHYITNERIEAEIRKQAERKAKHDTRLADQAAVKAARISAADAARAALLALPVATRLAERHRTPIFSIAGHAECDFYWRDAGVVSIYPEYIAKGWVLARVAKRWMGKETSVWVRVAFEPVPKAEEREK